MCVGIIGGMACIYIYVNMSTDVLSKGYIHNRPQIISLFLTFLIDILKISYYHKLSEPYKALNMNIKRADVSRYLLLLQFGGVYMDLDMDLKSPIQPVSRLHA